MEGFDWFRRVVEIPSWLEKDTETDDDEDEGREQVTGDSRSRVGEGLEEKKLLLVLESTADLVNG